MCSDHLKPLDQIGAPDPRHGVLASTLGRHHAVIELMQLDDSAPDDVLIHYETARNLLLYSWFVYRFLPLAEMQAYASVERALKLRIGEATLERRRGLRGFRKLLEYAIAQGWLDDEGFAHHRRMRERREHNMERLAEILGESSAIAADEGQQPCVQILSDSLPSLRNVIAHGDRYLSHTTYFTLELCRDIIQQLFRPTPL